MAAGILPCLGRRSLLAGVAASFAMPSRASVAGDVWLTTAGIDRGFAAVALDSRFDAGNDAASTMRLHGVAANPVGPMTVAVGRRPGRTALVYDRERGGVPAEFAPGNGRVFSGHGLFTPDGRRFLTNELERRPDVLATQAMGRGTIAVRDVAAGFAIISEWPTGGDGPHDLLHRGTAIIIANGGIEPHTPQARDAEVAGSSMTMLDATTGILRAEMRTTADLASLSLRHLADHPTGGIVAAAQDLLADGTARPLLFAVGADGSLTPFDAPEGELRQLRGYVGSVTFDRSGAFVACTSPRGGRIAIWQSNGRYAGAVTLIDGCGVAATRQPAQFIATNGYGEVAVVAVHEDGIGIIARHNGGPRFDNHIIAVT